MSTPYPSFPGDQGPQANPGAAGTPQPAPYGAQPHHAYASWGLRVGGSLIDSLVVLIPGAVLMAVGFGVAFAGSSQDPVTGEVQGVNGVGFVLVFLGALAFLLIDLWNRVFRQGSTGQSLGKQALGMRLVGHTTGSPVGAGAALGRWLIAMLIGFVPFGSLLDVLWPLWDDKNQTLHDKVIGSVVLRA